MKTTVEITDSLFDEAKAVAAKQGITFRVLLEEGLRSALEQRKTQASKPFKLRDGSFKGKGLAPGVRWEDMIEMAYDEERLPKL